MSSALKSTVTGVAESTSDELADEGLDRYASRTDSLSGDAGTPALAPLSREDSDDERERQEEVETDDSEGLNDLPDDGCFPYPPGRFLAANTSDGMPLACDGATYKKLRREQRKEEKARRMAKEAEQQQEKQGRVARDVEAGEMETEG